MKMMHQVHLQLTELLFLNTALYSLILHPHLIRRRTGVLQMVILFMISTIHAGIIENVLHGNKTFILQLLIVPAFIWNSTLLGLVFGRTTANVSNQDLPNGVPSVPVPNGEHIGLVIFAIAIRGRVRGYGRWVTPDLISWVAQTQPTSSSLRSRTGRAYHPYQHLPPYPYTSSSQFCYLHSYQPPLYHPVPYPPGEFTAMLNDSNFMKQMMPPNDKNDRDKIRCFYIHVEGQLCWLFKLLLSTICHMLFKQFWYIIM